MSLAAVLVRVDAALFEYGAAIKRRDGREPGRARKEKAEARLQKVLLRHFRAQRSRVQAMLLMRFADRKAAAFWEDDLESALGMDSEEFGADVLKLYLQTVKDGVALFSDTASINLDWTLTNGKATAWAQKYTGKMIKGIDDITLETVRQAVAAFVDTPGVTIGDVIKVLPFDGARAEAVAVTEITRAYAQSAQIAGEEIAKEYPGVKVVKKWFTNNDDRVCPICEPLDGSEVEIDEDFSDGVDMPPAHPNCRCWMSTETRINE